MERTWVDAGKSQYMILARSHVITSGGEGEMSRVCAQKTRKAYTLGAAQP